MSASLSPCPRSVIVTRLRAAGCVFAEDEARLLISAARTRADLAAMVDRRAAGLPLEHVLGWAEFCGLADEELGAPAGDEDAGVRGYPQAAELRPAEDVFEGQAGGSPVDHGGEVGWCPCRGD